MLFYFEQNFFSANVIQYQGPGEMPRDELLQSVQNADAIFCLLRDKIDKEVLDHGIFRFKKIQNSIF